MSEACVITTVLCAIPTEHSTSQSRPAGRLRRFLFGINDYGKMAGVVNEETGTLHGVFFSSFTDSTTFDYPGAVNTGFIGINNNGLISGGFITIPLVSVTHSSRESDARNKRGFHARRTVALGYRSGSAGNPTECVVRCLSGKATRVSIQCAETAHSTTAAMFRGPGSAISSHNYGFGCVLLKPSSKPCSNPRSQSD